MEIFIISFVVYLLLALAIGIGILFRGKSMPAGCRGPLGSSSCKSKSLCGNQCRKVRDV